MNSYVDYPEWRPGYAPSLTKLLEEIPLLFDKVKQSTKDPQEEDFIKGFVEAYRILYITECNRGEKNGTQTVSATEDALTPTTDSTQRIYKKTQNLHKAIIHLFEQLLIVDGLKHQLTPELAKTVNKIIGDELFSGAGCYRTSDAKPSGYDFIYMTPATIDSEMKKLFEEINNDMTSGRCQWFEIAGKFLERFLLIHPFSNGNGRTARLLLSALLGKHSIVPVYLFNACSINKPSSNEIYLHCLTEAHEYGNFSLLNSLIIESTHNCLELFVYAMDLPRQLPVKT